MPLKLEYAFTGLARGEEADWIHERFHAACAELGTDVHAEDDLLVIEA